MTMLLADHATTYLAAGGHITGNSLDGLKHIVLGMVGTLILIVLGVHGIKALLTGRWGDLIGTFAAAVLVGGFAYAPDSAQSLIMYLWHLIVGG
jgi:hypothetical protein